MAAGPDVVFGEVTEVDWGGQIRRVIYIEVIDADLFRLGKKAATKIDKLRYAEDDRPSTAEKPKKNDIATYTAGAQVKVRARSGGISVYDGISTKMRLGKSDQWWCIPAGAKIPAGLRVAKDATAGRDGLTHYSLEPATDMTVEDFLEKLKQFSEFMYKVTPSGDKA